MRINCYLRHAFSRFSYVSKILYALFSHDRFMQLPGQAQKILFRVLEEMADGVYSSHGHRNEHVLRKLVDELNATMTIYHVWGSHLGSASLFRQHADSRRKITEIVEKMQVGSLSLLTGEATPGAGVRRAGGAGFPVASPQVAQLAAAAAQ